MRCGGFPYTGVCPLCINYTFVKIKVRKQKPATLYEL